MKFLPLVVALLIAAYAVAGAAQPQGPPRIELADFDVEPAELGVGGSFTVRARAVATGVELGSFLLRTADEVRREDTVPGFPLYASGKYYVAEDGRYYLWDNGSRDADPRPGAFALEVSTKGWKEGTYAFALFASCRPADGPFVAARHDFAAVVAGGRVKIEDLGSSSPGASRTIAAFCVEPATVAPGEPVTVSVETRTTAIRGLQITDPFYIAPADALPGFFYDAEAKKSYLGDRPDAVIADGSPRDRDAQPRNIVVTMETAGWPPGVHHLLARVIGISGREVDHRSFAVKVPGPADHLDVTVEASTFFAPGTHFGRFVGLGDGTILCADKRSADGGRTWEGPTGGFGAGAQELRDGPVLGLEYRCLPEAGKPGWYVTARSVSTDGGRRFEKDVARFHVPEAKAAMGHASHKGPLFMRSIVERGDGSLVALMAGWFKSDTALCPYGRGRPYSRSYVCESSDRGRTWEYLVTIGYEQLGSEGYNEGSMRRLPGGELLAVLRTGNERDPGCQDNPIMQCTSRDEGRTWTPPQRTGLEGAYPSLAVLSDGLVAMTYGRPGAMVAFSADGGRTWTDLTPVDTTPYSGYTDVVEIAPGELLVGFGAADYLDPATGTRQNHLRLARVRYREP